MRFEISSWNLRLLENRVDGRTSGMVLWIYDRGIKQ